MRVRVIQLRLLAGALFALWVATFALLLIGYRPGGPADVVVAVSGMLPALIAAAALVWPPQARGSRAHVAIMWLATLAILVLVPSLAGIAQRIRAGGPQTLLPSPEAAYPWLLALALTALFTGLGLARHRPGVSVLSRRWIALGTALGLAMTVIVGSAFGGAAIANELALRDRPSISSRFGPTDPAIEPPACDGTLAAGSTAHLGVRISGRMDDRSMGSLTIAGTRDGRDIRWLGYAATTARLGQIGVARVDDSAWTLAPGSSWVPAPTGPMSDQDLDLQLMRTALTPENRVVAQMLGIDFLEGARARHCRIAVDGETFRRAVPQVSFLVGAGDISRWRGELDFWVFADGGLGQVDARLNGSAAGIADDSLLGEVTYRLTAVDRGVSTPVARPVR